jgi:hypothetical protein
MNEFLDKLSSYNLFNYLLPGVLFVGSLIIEPLFKRSKIITFADYRDFVAASKIDDKIEVLSEANNVYRTFCSLFSCLAALVAIQNGAQYFGVNAETLLIASVFFLFVLFAFAYRKQTAYITKRISASKDKAQ